MEEDVEFEIKDEHEKELEEQRLIEERRRRRQMILEKHKANTAKKPDTTTNGMLWYPCIDECRLYSFLLCI